jgi:formate hydrogenlyase transcriptional activator
MNSGFPAGQAPSVAGTTTAPGTSGGAISRLLSVEEFESLSMKLEQSQADLREQLQFRMLIGDMFSRLVELGGDSVEKEIGRALRDVRDFVRVDQITLLRFSEGGGPLRVMDHDRAGGPQWIAEGTREEELPWYTQMLREGRVIRLSSLAQWPPEAAPELARASAAGVKSHLCLPMSVRGAALGGMALTSYRSERDWSDGQIEQLRVISQMIASVLVLQSMEIKLRQSVMVLKRQQSGLKAHRDRLQDEIEAIDPRDQIVGHARPMKRVLEEIQQVAATDSTVLILGETGTGKELIARAIHAQSNRRSRLMVKVNCAAIPSALVESELFGRERGAYTGALSKQAGRFELADGSTILLDEIGDLPLELQGKLLRVLEEGEFQRLGSSETIRVNARIIASTNRNLAKAVREGTFREDLYYRLNVFVITVPPLREHISDIPALVWSFVRQFGESMAKTIESIPKQTMEALQEYPWPGNVRQLRNVIEHGMIVTSGPELVVELPQCEGIATGSALALKDVERKHILEVLARTNWRVSGRGGAADLLGMKPTTLESRMQKLGIRRRA